jgi:ABC-2 type transport system permease protein
MSDLSEIRLRPWVVIAQRELADRLRSKSYVLATVSLIVVAILAVVVGGFSNDERPVRVVALGDTSALLASPQFGDQRGYELASADSKASAIRLLQSGQADLVVETNEITTMRPVVEHSAIAATVSQIRATLIALQVVSQTGGPTNVPSTTDANAQANSLVVTALDDDVSTQDLRRWCQIGLVMVYLAIVFYGYWVTSGVNEEKQTRVAEVLLGAARPTQLLAGKVIGVGLAGLVQLTCTGVASGVTAIVAGVSLPGSAVTTGLVFGFWFVVGYAMACSVFAAAGSLASRSEEANNAATPVSILLLLGLACGMIALSDPSGWVARTTQFVPFTAPFVMPVRQVLVGVSLVEFLVSLILSFVFTYAVVRLAARVYSGGIRELRGRVRISAAWRAQ